MSKEINYKGHTIISAPYKSGEEGSNYIVNGSIESVKGKYIDVIKLNGSNEEAQCNTEGEADEVFILRAKNYIDEHII